MDVTCCIACRNHGSTLKLAVESAFTAGCNSVTVYDDGSTDSTETVIQNLLNRYSGYFGAQSGDIRVGASIARNRIIEDAPDGLIICLDADDTIHGGGIKPLVDAYEEHVWCYGDHTEWCNEIGTPHKGRSFGTLHAKMCTGVTFLFHKQDWYTVGGFDPDFAYMEDWAFQCALANAGIRGKYVDTIVYDRYINPKGNERSALAGQYYNFYDGMIRRKYPNI